MHIKGLRQKNGQQQRFVKDCMYQAWCEQHRDLEDAWMQAADRLEEAEKGLHGTVKLKEIRLKEVAARDAMLGAGCPMHSSHVYSASAVAVMRSVGGMFRDSVA